MNIKIAGVQTDVHFRKPADNLARMNEWVNQAAGQGAQLIVFPECFTTGYCFNSLDEAMPYAETIPGPSTEAATGIARRHGVFIVFGLLEIDDAQIFNACVCVGPDGLVGEYRKIHLPQLGIDRFATPGDRPFAVQQAGDLRIGMHICYDCAFSESGRLLSLAGADLLVLPTNWPPGAETTAEHVINARSIENKVFSIAVNRIGRERGFQFIGRSRICDEQGNSLATASNDQEEIIFAEIDPMVTRHKRIERVPGKHSIDRFADRRPEMYGAIVEPVQTENPV